MKISHKTALHLISLVILISIPYLNSLQNDFVWLDRTEILEGSKILHSPLHLLQNILQGNPQSSHYYRPFYHLMHTTDYLLWGNNPVGYHGSSLGWHLLNLVLFYLLLVQFHSKQTAFTIAAIWGMLPVNTASVSLVHSKADLLVTFFVLLLSLLATRFFIP